MQRVSRGGPTGPSATMRRMDEPPGGLTLVFTDIEGSTALVRELKGSYGLALRVHQSMIERCFAECRGTPVGHEGDGLFYVFSTPADAVTATIAAQRKVEHHEWPVGVRLRVRMGVHSGPVTVSGGEYVGLTVHEASRICAAAHGGQILCSEAVVGPVCAAAVECSMRDLGVFVLRGFPAGSRLFQVDADGLEEDFPPPRDTLRDGGTRVSMWFRGSPVASAGADALCFQAIAGGPLGDDVGVEIGRASHGPPGAFRVVVRESGAVAEEYDGLTVGGAADAASIVNSHSRLIRVEEQPSAGSRAEPPAG